VPSASVSARAPSGPPASIAVGSSQEWWSTSRNRSTDYEELDAGMMHLLAAAALCAQTDQVQPPTPFRVASVQMAVTDDLSANLARMQAGMDEAARGGARVVVLPETVLSGFTERAVAALDWAKLDAAQASVARAAARHRIYVIYGSATRSETAKPFNSAIVVGPDGREICRYHKSFPEAWFEPGERSALFDIEGTPCTVIVCHDNRFPEMVRVPALAGARVCFYISYEINSREAAERKREGYRAQSIARAAENGIWWVQANGVGPEAGLSLSLGNSVIVDPGGAVVAQAPELKPAIIYADIDPARATRANALEGLGGKLLGDWWRSAVDELRAQQRADAAMPDSPKKSGEVRLALLQAVPVKWDLQANFATFERLLDQASGADILITPECWLDGYAAADKGSTPERLRSIAQDPATSPYIRRIAEQARLRRMMICFGFTSLEKGRVYNAAGLWDKTGKLVGIYHKTHLQTHDLQFAPGKSLPVWSTEWGPIGIMICADRRWPETARTLRLQGARLILNPTYGMRHLANQWWMRTRSYENQCFIAFAHPEVGLIVGPKGELIAKRLERPGVLLCDVDLSLATDDNHLRDRRPELYGPITRREPRRRSRATDGRREQR